LEASLSTHELVRPWRRATLVASAIAAFELVLLVVCAAVIVAKPLARAVQRHAAKAAVASKPVASKPAVVVHTAIRQHVAPVLKPAHARGQTDVLVLNGNGRTGAAHAEAATLQGLGYRIAATADAKRNDYATSVVMYKTGYRAEGLRLARDLHVRVVAPLDGLPPAQLQGGQLAVIIGRG
jgi:LytR cell envelope-related transcriptional attenuator